MWLRALAQLLSTCAHPAAALERTRQRRRLAAAVAGQDNVVGQQCLELGQVAVVGGLEEAAGEFILMLAGRLESWAVLGDMAPGATRELAHVGLALADDRRDVPVGIVKGVVQQEGCALLGAQALEQQQHRHRDRVGGLRLTRRIVAGVGDDRLGQPVADVELAPGASRAQFVDRQPGTHGRHKCARRGDRLVAVERLVDAKQRLLGDVLRL